MKRQRPVERAREPAVLNSDGTFTAPDYFDGLASPVPTKARKLVEKYKMSPSLTHREKADLEADLEKVLASTGYQKTLSQLAKSSKNAPKASSLAKNKAPYSNFLLLGGRPNDFIERRNVRKVLERDWDSAISARIWALIDRPDTGPNMVRERILNQVGDEKNGDDQAREHLLLALIETAEKSGVSSLPDRRKRKGTLSDTREESTQAAASESSSTVFKSHVITPRKRQKGCPEDVPEMVWFREKVRQVLEGHLSGDALERAVANAVTVARSEMDANLTYVRRSLSARKTPEVLTEIRRALRLAQEFFNIPVTDPSTPTDPRWKASYRAKAQVYHPDRPNGDAVVMMEVNEHRNTILRHATLLANLTSKSV